MSRRWNLITAAPAAAAAILVGGWAVSAGSSAGRPTDASTTICGNGSVGADNIEGSSNQDHPSSSMFSGNQQNYQQNSCNADNSSSGSVTWKILHSNVDVVSERGTEHGELLGLMVSGMTANEAGFDGHITDYDLESNGDSCTDGQGRTVYYSSGTANPGGGCTLSFGPVGNFNTHGGAQNGTHFRGTYGTVIFQQSSNTHNCDPSTTMYCIEVDLAGQTN